MSLSKPRTLLTALTALLVAALAVPVIAQTTPSVTAYRVHVENLTGGQPFTPPVVAVHSSDADVFTTGTAASEGVQQIAENGNNDPLVTALDGVDAVADVATGDAPIVPSGRENATDFSSEATIMVAAGDGADLLSLTSMLICTNDGFVGLDGVALPTTAGASLTYEANGYDAGTEVNTEDFADMVPPCQGLIGVATDDEGTGATDPALAEDGVITRHPGIEGDADLIHAVHSWLDPVARVTVTALADTRVADRLAGPTRIETAVAISQAQFPDGSDTVYLANAQTTVDAVAGGVLTEGPILMVPQCGELPEAVGDEITRLDAVDVVALGGDQAICDDILEAATTT